MNDDFLHSLHMPPRSEFAAALQQRLAAQDRQRRRRARVASMVQVGSSVTVCLCLVVALHLGAVLRRNQHQVAAIGAPQRPVASELLPVSQLPQFSEMAMMADAPVLTVELRVSATAIPHHHQ